LATRRQDAAVQGRHSSAQDSQAARNVLGVGRGVGLDRHSLLPENSMDTAVTPIFPDATADSPRAANEARANALFATLYNDLHRLARRQVRRNGAQNTMAPVRWSTMPGSLSTGSHRCQRRQGHAFPCLIRQRLSR
jgi:hypothetical protein